MPRLEHPYAQTAAGTWTKGTLHAHGPHTGGRLAPQRILDLLAEKHYGFAMVVEHDVLPPREEWESLNSRGLVLLRGYEMTRGPHLLHVHADEVIENQSDTQCALDTVKSQGGLAIAAHPSFGGDFDHIPARAMVDWQNLTGLEIYNPYIHRTPGSAWAIDKWDYLLSRGRRVWGFADDDAFSQDDIGLGFIVVHTPEKPDVNALVSAMRDGRFFASSGLWFDRIEADGMTVRLRAPGAHRIAAIGMHGARMAITRGETIEFTVSEHASYVRFEAAGEADQFAWTQPFFVT